VEQASCATIVGGAIGSAGLACTSTGGCPASHAGDLWNSTIWSSLCDFVIAEFSRMMKR
jgi:hypothetical protein